MSIEQRWTDVRERVVAAARRVGRDPDDVAVVCVTKKHPVESIREAALAGARDLGENYAQELEAKAEALGDSALRWHFIGTLQRNKAKLVVGRAHLIHAVDSERLLRAIDHRAQALGVTQKVLLSVNVAGEATKSGVLPAELSDLLNVAGELAAAEVVGLMTMPPFPKEAEDNRGHFRKLGVLRETHAAEYPELLHLSMGTTGDYEVAVEEGATLVRVGTAVMGPRPS